MTRAQEQYLQSQKMSAIIDGRRVTEHLIQTTLPDEQREFPIDHPPSELGEAIKSLDNDSYDPKTRMTQIDFNARLNVEQIVQYSILDFLVSMRFLPAKTLQLTRQLKRVSVSRDGEGRKEKVAMTAGQREHESMRKTIGTRLRDWFGR